MSLKDLASQDTNKSIKFKDKTINLDQPIIMGILNVTPDSFFDGGKNYSESVLINHVLKMLDEGASIIDVGGHSTRPKASEVSEQEELNRVFPVVQLLSKEFPELIISIDTFRSSIAEKCIDSGASIVNDISGGMMDENMFRFIGASNIPYVLTHIQGTFKTMQDNPRYDNIIQDVEDYFNKKIDSLNQLGADNIFIDPGFGFGKTVEDNYKLLGDLEKFKSLGFPILAGLSRKSMINKVINTTPQEALNGTTVLNTIALSKGATVLRVHDVKEAKQAIKLIEKINEDIRDN